MGFKGYKRPDGRCGVRNHVLVISSVSCANGVVNAISRELPGLKPVTHSEGCGRGLRRHGQPPGGTGRGSPVGFPIVPVIKVASNSEVFASMEDDMDVNAGKLLEGTRLEEAAREIIGLVERVSNGEPPKAERNQQDCLAIHTVGSAF